jgi:hypothetical protein
MHPLSHVIAEMSQIVGEYAPNLNQHVLLTVCAMQLKEAGLDCFAASKTLCRRPGCSDPDKISHIWGICWQGDAYSANANGWQDIMETTLIDLSMLSNPPQTKQPQRQYSEKEWMLASTEPKPVSEDAELGLFFGAMGRHFPNKVQIKRDELNQRLLAIGACFVIDQSTSPGRSDGSRPRL